VGTPAGRRSWRSGRCRHRRPRCRARPNCVWVPAALRRPPMVGSISGAARSSWTDVLAW